MHLLRFAIFFPVFEKPPRFAIILVVVKAVGYLIAVIGFAVCVTGKHYIYFTVSRALFFFKKR